MNFFANLQILGAIPGWEAIKNFFASTIEFFYNLTETMGIPSYVLAIFIFTVIIKLLLQPLMNKQMRATRRMQMLSPEVEEIKKRYANNQQKQQQATMALYKEHNASPTAGCLPLLVQMPILIALFDTIRNFAPLHPESFNFWIWTDLAVPVSEGLYPLLLPALAAGATFLQQFLLTANRKDRMQRMMLFAFPIMFFFVVRSFPILMAFYWIFYSLIGAAIMYPILRSWHKKDTEEIERKRAERAAEEEERRAKKSAAKEAYHKGKPRKQIKSANNVDDAEMEDEDISEDFDEDEEEDPEKLFRIWLKENEYSIRKKKMKLHPYSPEAEIVELAFDKKDKEVSMETLRREFDASQGAVQAPSSLGELFGLSKRKDKKTP